MKSGIKKVIVCNSGESLSEALFSFLIATVSSIVIAISVVGANNLIGKAAADEVKKEEAIETAQAFLRGAGDGDIGVIKVIIDDALERNVNVELYKEKDIIAFRYERK